MFNPILFPMKKPGVLLLNLGSPDSTKVADVRRYLKEFLGDKRVLDGAPRWLLWLVLNAVILRKRPAESAEAYGKIWTEQGSPLIVISKRQQQLLSGCVNMPVELAMRYGSLTATKALERLKQMGVTDLLVLPLYPHYAMSSYETAVVNVQEAVSQVAPAMNVDFLQPFYQDLGYINALVKSAEPYLRQDFDKLLFSFHGIPERHLRQTDPSHAHCMQVKNCCSTCNPAHATCYRHQCFQTVEHFIKASGIEREKVAVSFQSRLGREPWLKPYTDEAFLSMPAQGIKKLLVISPAFTTDCLETLEELAMRGKEDFLNAGGTHFELIPCLNENPLFIDFLKGVVQQWADKYEFAPVTDLLAHC